jgi:hypothetical protein
MAVTHFWCHALCQFLLLINLFTLNVLGESGIIRFPITVVDAPTSGLAKRQAPSSSEYPVSLVNGQTLYLVESMCSLRSASNSNKTGTKTDNSLVYFGTPPQPIAIQIDTGSVELWVNPNCTAAADPSASYYTSEVAKCQADPQYNPSLSTTSSKQQYNFVICYGAGGTCTTGPYYNDTVSVSSTPSVGAFATTQWFGVSTESSGLTYGILGLGQAQFPLYAANSGTFIYNLATQGRIGSPAFSVDLRSINDPAGKNLIRPQ